MDEVKHLIVKTLEEMFPNAFCELTYSNNFELLIAVMLSAQTTDIAVNKVTKLLFSKFKTVEDYINANIEDIENEIKTLGLYKNKAKNLKKMSQILKDEFNSVVPNTRENLMKLPGVGRKTANVVLSVAFKQNTFAVDTHVERVSKRLGIAGINDNVLQVENKLMAFFTSEQWGKLHHQLIFFGRYHCKALKPNCNSCELSRICKKKELENGK